MVQWLLKMLWQFLTKLSILLPYDPAIPLKHKAIPLCIYWMQRLGNNCLQELYSEWRKTRNKYPPSGRWINKLWTIHRMDYCSPIKDKKGKTGTYNMNQSIKHFVVGGEGQAKKRTYYIIPLIWSPRTHKLNLWWWR